VTVARPSLLTLALAMVAASASVAVPAAAASDGAGEADCDGVLVVVDARALGGDHTVGCAAGQPDTGLTALSDAGHDYRFVPTIAGLICTIDGLPDPCTGLTEEAYWGYWHAPGPQGPWTYSVHGAGFRTPPPGSVEGWRFGDGNEPPDLPAPAPQPVSTASAASEAVGVDGDAPRDRSAVGVLVGIGLTLAVLALALLHRRRTQGPPGGTS
jgi:hypothetical protein